MGVWQSKSTTMTTQEELTKLVELRNQLGALLTELNNKVVVTQAEIESLNAKIAQAEQLVNQTNQTNNQSNDQVDIEAPAPVSENVAVLQDQINQINTFLSSLKASTTE